MKIRKCALGAVLLGLAVTGCSDSEPQAAEDVAAPPGAAAFPEATYDESEVVDHLGMDYDGSYWWYREDGVECEVAVVLTSAGSVSMYADAGDVVATNPDQTVGVKITSPNSRECHEAVTEALADFPS